VNRPARIDQHQQKEEERHEGADQDGVERGSMSERG
jgi:hypothetical protein